MENPASVEERTVEENSTMERTRQNSTASTSTSGENQVEKAQENIGAKMIEMDQKLEEIEELLEKMDEEKAKLKAKQSQAQQISDFDLAIRNFQRRIDIKIKLRELRNQINVKIAEVVDLHVHIWRVVNRFHEANQKDAKAKAGSAEAEENKLKRSLEESERGEEDSKTKNAKLICGN